MQTLTDICIKHPSHIGISIITRILYVDRYSQTSARDIENNSVSQMTWCEMKWRKWNTATFVYSYSWFGKHSSNIYNFPIKRILLLAQQTELWCILMKDRSLWVKVWDFTQWHSCIEIAHCFFQQDNVCVHCSNRRSRRGWFQELCTQDKDGWLVILLVQLIYFFSSHVDPE